MNNSEYFFILNDNIKDFLLSNPITQSFQGYEAEDKDYERFNYELYNSIKDLESIYKEVNFSTEKANFEFITELESLQIKNMDVEEQINYYYNLRNSKEKEISRLKNEISRVENLINHDKREMSNLPFTQEKVNDSDNNNLNENLTRLHEQVKSMQEEIDHISRKIQRKELQISSAENELLSLESRISNYNEKIQRMSEKASFFKQKTSSIKSSIATLREKEYQLSVQCKKLQKENTRHKGGGKSEGEAIIRSRPRKTSAKKKVEAIAKKHYSKLDSDGEDSIMSSEKESETLFNELQVNTQEFNSFPFEKETNSVIQECSSVDSNDRFPINSSDFYARKEGDWLRVDFYNFGLTISCVALSRYGFL